MKQGDHGKEICNLVPKNGVFWRYGLALIAKPIFGAGKRNASEPKQ